MEIPEVIQLVATISLVIVTLVYVIYTWKIAKTNEKAFAMNQKLMEHQTRPWVLVYLEIENISRIHTVMGLETPFIERQNTYLVIENIGHEPAIDIYFDILPDHALSNGKKISDLGFLKQHLNLLAPGSKRKIFFADVYHSKSEIQSLKFRINVQYFGFKGEFPLSASPHAYTDRFDLDMSEFKDEFLKKES